MVVALVVCIVIIIVLAIKLIVMKHSLRSVSTQFREIVNTDTNAVIGVSSADGDVKKLAASINKTLVDLRKEHHRYEEGDMEMKMALTNISHDLRTPLTAICGHLELVRDEDMSSEVRRVIEIIEDRALYMKKLTEELFEFSLIMTSNDDVPKEETVINRILENTIIDYYAALTKKGIEPKINITETKVIRTVNKQQLDRVFSNLISNAIKYSDGDLEVSLSDTGTVVFANDAKGMDKLQTEKLFNRFYTVESARNSTGLGLSIAKKFVEENGGTIGADYENGRLNISISL